MKKSNTTHSRVAVITGAGRGIGRHISQHLAEAGINIAGLDVRESDLQMTLSSIEKHSGVRTLSQRCDVGVENDVIQSIERVLQHFGRIDVLVNNAGVRNVAPVWETTATMWDETFSVNTRGEFLCTREVLRQFMLEENKGKIIFVSSIAGRRGGKNSSAYSASKWAIRGLAASVALELKGTEINVTTITPGRTATPMSVNSENWDPELGWLDADAIATVIRMFVEMPATVEIPEIHLHHRSELS